MADSHFQEVEQQGSRLHTGGYDRASERSPQAEAPSTGSFHYPGFSPRDPRLGKRANAPLRAAVLSDMQHACGNRSVQRLLDRAGSEGAQPLAVQRQEDIGDGMGWLLAAPPLGVTAPSGAASSAPAASSPVTGGDVSRAISGGASWLGGGISGIAADIGSGISGLGGTVGGPGSTTHSITHGLGVGVRDIGGVIGGAVSSGGGALGGAAGKAFDWLFPSGL